MRGPSPGFRSSEIRRSMDVYSFDNAYLGSVLWVLAEGGISGRPDLPGSVLQESYVGGEDLGPAPTQSVGNPGPITQSARRRYGVGNGEHPVLRDGTMLVGHAYGLLGVKLIPLDDIQTVALERIVLRFPKGHYR